MAIPLGSCVKQEDYLTAKAFIDALDDSSRWAQPGEWSSPWVFRGQQDALWDLIPSAWRDIESVQLKRLNSLKFKYVNDANLIFKMTSHPNIDIKNAVTACAQAEAEKGLLKEFILTADAMGYSVPNMEGNLNWMKTDLADSLTAALN
jgi:hypothetical protein